MNERQRRFVDEYVKSGNAAEAYVRAGYSPNGADAHAARLVGNGSISAAIADRRREMELTGGIERKHLLGILLGIAANGDKDSARVAAVRQLSRMLGYDAPRRHQIEGPLVITYQQELPGGQRVNIDGPYPD